MFLPGRLVAQFAMSQCTLCRIECHTSATLPRISADISVKPTVCRLEFNYMVSSVVSLCMKCRITGYGIRLWQVLSQRGVLPRNFLPVVLAQDVQSLMPGYHVIGTTSKGGLA